MKTIRRNIFETNSSSTHSVTIMSKEDYDKWSNENLYWDDEKLITREELFLIFKEDQNKYTLESVDIDLSEENFEEWLSENNFISFDSYYDDCYLETDTTRHTTKSGDEIIILCKYGHDS